MKKRTKRILTAGLALTLIGAQAVTVSADITDDIAAAQAEQAATSSQLSALNTQIDDLETKKTEITGEIDSLNSRLVTTIAAINLYDDQIAEKEEDLEQTAIDLADALATQDEQYDAMKKRIQYIYENGGTAGWAMVVLNRGNISEFIDNAQNTQSMYEYDRESLEEYAATVETVNTLQEQQLSEKADLVNMRSEQESAKENLQALLLEAQATSDDYDTQIAEATEQAEEYQALIVEQNEKIAELQAQKEAEEAAAAAAAAEAAAAAAAAEEAAASTTTTDTSANTSTSGSTSTTSGSTGSTSSTTSGSTSASTSGSTSTGSESTSASTSSGTTTTSTTTETTSSTTSSSSSSNASLGQQIASYACQFVGNPYVYGGNSLTNGIDCSGFVQQVFAHFGISLSRTTYTQLYEGTAVSASDIQPGDVINYGSHTAIYIGNGQIVHASNERDGIKISTNAWYRTVVGIRRYY